MGVDGCILEYQNGICRLGVDKITKEFSGVGGFAAGGTYC